MSETTDRPHFTGKKLARTEYVFSRRSLRALRNTLHSALWPAVWYALEQQ